MQDTFNPSWAALSRDAILETIEIVLQENNIPFLLYHPALTDGLLQEMADNWNPGGIRDTHIENPIWEGDGIVRQEWVERLIDLFRPQTPKNIKYYTDEEFKQRFEEYWDTHPGEHHVPTEFNFFLLGEIIRSRPIHLETHMVWFIVIERYSNKITPEQLCHIMDFDLNRTSVGSITYENEFAYITWSTLGHG